MRVGTLNAQIVACIQQQLGMEMAKATTTIGSRGICKEMQTVRIATPCFRRSVNVLEIEFAPLH